MIFLISASWVAWITEVSHGHRTLSSFWGDIFFPKPQCSDGLKKIIDFSFSSVFSCIKGTGDFQHLYISELKLSGSYFSFKNLCLPRHSI
jgi:hypothetical protein